VNRTLMRPRDPIEFFNNILEHAAGRATLTRDMVLQGEGVYSKNRLRSLQDEWINEYPALIEFSALLKQQSKIFRLATIAREVVEDPCLSYAVNNYTRTDLLSVQARAVAEGIQSWESFLYLLMQVFYITGIVGLKTETFESHQWAYQGPSTVIADTINLETSASIHPMFYRVLGVKP